jgi:hypothetical protein
MAKPKNFYDVSCTTVDQHGNKDQTYMGCFTSRKKVDEEITRVKRITVQNKADAEFHIRVRINYMALGKLTLSRSRLPFRKKEDIVSEQMTLPLEMHVSSRCSRS